MLDQKKKRLKPAACLLSFGLGAALFAGGLPAYAQEEIRTEVSAQETEASEQKAETDESTGTEKTKSAETENPVPTETENPVSTAAENPASTETENPASAEAEPTDPAGTENPENDGEIILAETDGPYAANLSISAFDLMNGTATICITDVQAPGGVRSVVVPSWYRKDQGDLEWIPAQRGADGNYYAKLSIADHGTAWAWYYSDVYVTGGDGNMAYVGGLRPDFRIPNEGVKAVLNADASVCSVSVQLNAQPAGVQAIRAAVWTRNGGQDDLQWISLSANGQSGLYSGSFGTDTLKHYGEFFVDVYAESQSGTMSYVGGTTGKRQPVFSGFALTDDFAGQTGKEQTRYTGRLRGLSGAEDFSQIKAAVWSFEGGQDDLVWYDLTREADGSYVFTLPIQNHRTAGKYACDLYGLSADGFTFITSNTELNIDGIKTGSVSASPGKQLELFDVTISGIGSPSGLDSVVVPVWSAEDGQDDLMWMPAERQKDGTWKVTVDATDHNLDLGLYYIDVYGTTGNGLFGFAGGVRYEFYMEPNVTEVSGGAGSRTLRLYNPSKTPDQVAVWTTAGSLGGQDDVIWLPMKKQPEGYWEASLDLADLLHSGPVVAHFYAGNRVIADTSFEITDEEWFQHVLLTGNDSNIDFVQCAINIAKNDAIGYGHTWPSTLSCSGLVGLSLTYCGYADFTASDPARWGYSPIDDYFIRMLTEELGCTYVKGPFDSTNCLTLVPGDILYTPDHVGIYIGGGLTVEARGPAANDSTDENGFEIAIYDWTRDMISFQGVYRMPSSTIHRRTK